MKRNVLKKLGALALSAALTASLVPGAWAADYKGADLNISGSVRGSGSQYSVQYAADLSVSGDATNNDIIALVNMARANEGWLEALRFTCYLEDSLLKNAVTSGDLADLKVKSCDIEAWSPRQQKYFEVCSCSNLGDAQARRLKIRIKGADGKMYLPHTLNNTVVAPPRMLIALLENNLQADGGVRVPMALRPYVGGMEILVPKH